MSYEHGVEAHVSPPRSGRGSNAEPIYLDIIDALSRNIGMWCRITVFGETVFTKRAADRYRKGLHYPSGALGFKVKTKVVRQGGHDEYGLWCLLTQKPPLGSDTITAPLRPVLPTKPKPTG